MKFYRDKVERAIVERVTLEKEIVKRQSKKG
jgi:hypothetical protein